MRGLSNPFSLLWRHRDLVLQFTQRELHRRTKGNRLGRLWVILAPLLMLGLYLFVFGVIMGGRFGVIRDETTYDFALALFLGLAIFQTIGDTLGNGPLLIISQPNFVKKVVFPLEVIPVASVIASMYNSLLSIALILVVAPFSHVGGSWLGLAYLPLLLLPLTFLSLGLSWGLAAIGVYLRDVAQIMPLAAQVVMFSSAVFYSPDKIPEPALRYLRLNPILDICDQARRAILWHMPIDWGVVLWIYVSCFLVLIAGYATFRRLRPYFAEVL